MIPSKNIPRSRAATAVAATETSQRALRWADLGIVGLGLMSAGVLLAWFSATSPALGAAGDTASAALVNAEGQPVGTVELTQMQNGTLVRASLENLPEGTHAFHIHTTGQCEPPFTSAGGHYNPANAKHGFDSQGGPHAGDMPNIHVPASGQLTFEVFNTYLEVDDMLLDEDGAAVMVHDHADDYESDPAGDAGPRIACGVLKGAN